MASSAFPQDRPAIRDSIRPARGSIAVGDPSYRTIKGILLPPQTELEPASPNLP